MQSCTSGRNAFFTGMYPVRTGMIPPQLPGSPSYPRPGTPAMAKFLRDLGYNTGEFGKNHLGDHTVSLPTAHGFQEWLCSRRRPEQRPERLLATISGHLRTPPSSSGLAPMS
jgi:arylsulfatase A-like enzyme